MKLNLLLAALPGILQLGPSTVAASDDTPISAWSEGMTTASLNSTFFNNGFSVSLANSPDFPSGTEVHCSGYPMPDMTWVRQTVHDMGVWCDSNKLAAHTWKVWWYGGAQTYVCSYASGVQGCSDEEYWMASPIFDNHCGANGAYLWIPEWAKVIGRDPNNLRTYTPECL